LNYKQAQAALKAEKANLELARAQEQQAKSSLAIAQKDLDDSLVVAPIDGVICQRLLEPGEMAGAGTPVLRIDNLTVVEFTAYLPEAYYARVVEGETVVRAKSGGIDIGEVVVTTKSPTISPRLRTFEIKALLKNPPAGVVPGGIVELVVVLEKRNALGVPRESLVRRENGLALFTAKDGAARMMPVEAGLETDGWVEVRGDGLTKGLQIVRMGQDRLNNGMAVVEVKEEAE
jgi:RND family efflux transporter MFP subunit